MLKQVSVLLVDSRIEEGIVFSDLAWRLLLGSGDGRVVLHGALLVVERLVEGVLYELGYGVQIVEVLRGLNRIGLEEPLLIVLLLPAHKVVIVEERILRLTLRGSGKIILPDPGKNLVGVEVLHLNLINSCLKASYRPECAWQLGVSL